MGHLEGPLLPGTCLYNSGLTVLARARRHKTHNSLLPIQRHHLDLVRAQVATQTLLSGRQLDNVANKLAHLKAQMVNLVSTIATLFSQKASADKSKSKRTMWDGKPLSSTNVDGRKLPSTLVDAPDVNSAIVGNADTTAE